VSGLLIKYIFKAALRDRLILSLITMLIIGASLSVFFGSSAVIEQDRFTIVFAGGALRLIGIMGLVLFVTSFLRRSAESRDIEFLLTRPIGRVEFILSYALGFAGLAVCTGLAQTLFMYGLGPHLFNAGTMLWCFSVILENIIVVIVGMFFALVLSSAASASMVTFAFYVLGRMMGEILGIIDSGKAQTAEALEFTMQVVSVLMPRLDLMGQTSWLLYGYDGGISYGFLLAQAAVFCVLVLMASLIDILMRQF